MNELETRSDDEISLLDLLLIIAQNWLLLIVVPAIFGAIAFAVVFAQPQTYRSEATIGLPVQIVEALIASLEDEGTIDPRLTPTATGAGSAARRKRRSGCARSFTTAGPMKYLP
jgi:hypothetical protein